MWYFKNRHNKTLNKYLPPAYPTVECRRYFYAKLHDKTSYIRENQNWRAFIIININLTKGEEGIASTDEVAPNTMTKETKAPIKQKQDRIAVLIPCYNEGLTIRKVVQDWKAALPDATIYVYDNNSTDNTSSEATSAGAVVRREYMQGKGNVIRRMFREIEAQCYVMVDGDDTYSAEKAPEMVDLVLNRDVDMVVGDRLSSTYFQENKRPFHNFGNSITRIAINKLFHADIQDIMTGCRAFSRLFVKTFPVLSKGFEIETEMTIHAVVHNMSVANVVTQYRDRPEGSVSKLNTVKDGVKVIRTIIRLFKNCKPFAFFGALGAILGVTALAFFIPVLVAYFETGLVQRFPTLIFSGFMALAGLMSFFAGLVLDTLRQQHRQEFEFKLQTVSARASDSAFEEG